MASDSNNLEQYDIFLSYRRDGGETMSILLRDRLFAKGYRVFLDIESLKSGSFNKKLLSVIEGCTDVIVVCSKNSFDRCINEDDWVRIEISHALKHGKNIVPFLLRDFEWPDILPDEIEALRVQNGVNAGSNEYFDAVIDRLAENFLKSAPQNAFHGYAAEKPESPQKPVIGKRNGILAATVILVVLLALAAWKVAFVGTESERIGAGGTSLSSAPPPELQTGSIIIEGTQYSASMFEIDLSNMDLTNEAIVPLRYLTNLEFLDLGGNQISDLTPLSGLTKLTGLNLYDNKRISDLTPLANLANLTRLSLYFNQISDLTPLSGLTKLEWLELSGNQISDLKPLESLTNLKFLGLKNNIIEDWSPVAHIPNVSGRP